jgi:YXWGXW repeat-containing protein
MKTSTVYLGKANRNEVETGSRRVVLLALLLSALFSAGGCEGYYSAYPGYGPYYGSSPYYAGYPGGASIAVYDRPYYVRGPGYWSGGAYYVWKPGHWVWRNGQKVWIHGHYVVRGY